MQPLELISTQVESPTVLCLGAHCDDIEIGCGGTLLSLAKAKSDLRVSWVIFCGDTNRADESENAARQLLAGAASVDVKVLQFRDGFLPYDAANAKEALRKVASDIDPDLIFTHYRHDAHQDHRLVSDLTWNEFRDHGILEYEIPKFDGDLGTPNVYVPVAEEFAEEKLRILVECFRSQRDKYWFTRETFEALMRLRGIEAGPSISFAEAFHGRKLVLQAR